MKWIDLNDEEKAELSKVVVGGDVDAESLKKLEANPKIAFNRGLVTEGHKLRAFKVRDDDIWLASYCKSGTTLTQELLWQVVNGVKENCDGKLTFQRVPFFEMRSRLVDEAGDVIRGREYRLESILDLKQLAGLEGPRLIHSHLPFTILPENILDKAKVVYVVRNPKVRKVNLIKIIYNYVIA